MKKRQINLSWPAELYDFEKDSKQENFSRGKLKTYYEGETPDHRFFSKDFSKELVKSLPYTPVVSYYDEEKEDFVGHATEQQILGIVDPCVEPTFAEDEDGTKWCICDVVLYTERPDRVGDLAKKIVGHSQSLELDPHSVKYKINYDERKHFKNIEFTAGKFVGLSVLGEDQTPAFTGSAFFNYDEKFEEKMQMLRDYCEQDQVKGENNKMELIDFMKLSWGDISEKVANRLFEEFSEDGYVQMVDMFDDCVIFNLFYYTGNKKLLKGNYSIDDNGELTINSVKEVKVEYVEIEETESFEVEETSTTEVESEVEETPEVTEETTETKEETFEEEQPIEGSETEVDIQEGSEEQPVVEDTPVTEDPTEEQVEDPTVCVAAEDIESGNVESPVTNEEERENVDGEETETKDSGTSSFTESEKTELESLRKEKKLNLLNDYKSVLDEKEYNEFITSIDEFSFEALELDLLKKYKAKQDSKVEKVNEEDEEESQERVFAYTRPTKNAENNSLDALVKKYLRR